MRERILEGCVEAFGCFGRDAHLAGEAIGDAEADAHHVIGEAVRVGLHQRGSVGAVAPHDARGEAWSEPVGAQEHEHVLQVLLRLNCLVQVLDPTIAEAVHSPELLRIVLDEAKGVGTKDLDDLLGGGGADAAHEARGEVGLDALHGRGGDGFERLDLDLDAEAGVARLFAGYLKSLLFR